MGAFKAGRYREGFPRRLAGPVRELESGDDGLVDRGQGAIDPTST
jgi:hypothetical protein